MGHTTKQYMYPHLVLLHIWYTDTPTKDWTMAILLHKLYFLNRNEPYFQVDYATKIEFVK